MVTTKRKSRIIEEMQETIAGLGSAGVISKRRMLELDALKNLEVPLINPKEIKTVTQKGTSKASNT